MVCLASVSGQCTSFCQPYRFSHWVQAAFLQLHFIKCREKMVNFVAWCACCWLCYVEWNTLVRMNVSHMVIKFILLFHKVLQYSDHDASLRSRFAPADLQSHHFMRRASEKLNFVYFYSVASFIIPLFSTSKKGYWTFPLCSFISTSEVSLLLVTDGYHLYNGIKIARSAPNPIFIVTSDSVITV